MKAQNPKRNRRLHKKMRSGQFTEMFAQGKFITTRELLATSDDIFDFADEYFDIVTKLGGHPGYFGISNNVVEYSFTWVNVDHDDYEIRCGVAAALLQALDTSEVSITGSVDANHWSGWDDDDWEEQLDALTGGIIFQTPETK